MTQPTIGFIGTGVMGRSMARNLMDAGYALKVYTRTPNKAQPLLDRGARWCGDPAAVAAGSDIVITIVGFPRDVEEVYFGDRSILSALRPHSVAIDMTTSDPQRAIRIAAAAEANGAAALDAPVSGGDRGAREATLSIMVGGTPDVFERMRPVLNTMGSNVVLQGPPGSGQYTKMTNQIAIAANMLGVCEAMTYARKAGLDPVTVLKSIEHGAAGSWSLSNLIPRALQGDTAPGFFVKHFIKDMHIAIESAESMGLQLPALLLAKRLYDRLAASGGENWGTQSLLTLYEDGTAT